MPLTIFTVKPLAVEASGFNLSLKIKGDLLNTAVSLQTIYLWMKMQSSQSTLLKKKKKGSTVHMSTPF